MSIWLALFPLDIARIFIRFAFIEVKRRKIKDVFTARWQLVFRDKNLRFESLFRQVHDRWR